MIDNLQESKLEELLERIVEKVVMKSHLAVAEVQSNGLGAIKTELAVIKEVQHNMLTTVTEMKDYQKTQNGNVANAVKSIEDLRLSDTDIRSSFNGAKWIGGILVTVVIGLLLFIFNSTVNRLESKQIETSDKLTSYINKQTNK